MTFLDKNLQPLKYLILQVLILGGISILFWFTTGIGNHSMLESRANTRQQDKTQLLAKIDSIPRVLEAQASFSRLKRSLDNQRKYADSQLEMLKKLNEQEQKYITWPSKYMAIKANADDAESEALANLNKIRQEEADRINQSQATIEASVLGSFLDQHPSVVLSALALLFASIYFVPTFSKVQKFGLAVLSLSCETATGLIFGVGFYQSYIKDPVLVYFATFVTVAGICGAYGGLWQVFRFLMGLHDQALLVRPEPQIERNLPTVEPKVEVPSPPAKLEDVIGKSPRDMDLDELLAAVCQGRLDTKEICNHFPEVRPHQARRLVKRTLQDIDVRVSDARLILERARKAIERTASVAYKKHGVNTEIDTCEHLQDTE